MFRKRNLRPTLVGCGFRQPVLCYVLVGSYMVVLLYSLLLYCFLKTIHEKGEGGHDAEAWIGVSVFLHCVLSNC